MGVSKTNRKMDRFVSKGISNIYFQLFLLRKTDVLKISTFQAERIRHQVSF